MGHFLSYSKLVGKICSAENVPIKIKQCIKLKLLIYQNVHIFQFNQVQIVEIKYLFLITLMIWNIKLEKGIKIRV